MTTTKSYLNERLDHLGSWRACTKRSVMQLGWILKTPVIAFSIDFSSQLHIINPLLNKQL